MSVNSSSSPEPKLSWSAERISRAREQINVAAGFHLGRTGVLEDLQLLQRVHDTDDGIVNGEQRTPTVAEEVIDRLGLRRSDDVLLSNPVHDNIFPVRDV